MTHETYYQQHRERCLAYARAYRVTHKDAIKARREERRWADADLTPQVAHCGALHPVTSLPWACPTCGRPIGA